MLRHFLSILVVGLMVVFSGCVRLVGGAGYSYRGSEDASPQTKSVGFDTQNLVPGSLSDSAQIEMPSS